MPANQENCFAEILCVLCDHDVQFVVAGGVAVVLHGIERLTLDLDVAVSPDRDNLRRFLAALRRLELEPRAPVPAEFILSPQRLEQLVREKNAFVFTFWSPHEPYRQVDMFLTRENSFDDLAADAQRLFVRGHSVRVASRKKLIQMKQRIEPMREKDLFDIRALTEIEENIDRRDQAESEGAG
ncbi:MAG TPA: nucleotidyl transferase AbiEii/AbiGii toxin family protein [Chthoniobacterales bacterium]